MKKGFSLVELLVVISIIGTLTAIILPNLMGARERARDGKRKQDADAIKTGLRMFYNDTQSYPPDRIGMSGLGQTLATYVPNIGNMSELTSKFSYKQLALGDGFQLCVEMEAYGGEDVTASQESCKVIEAGKYTVCGFDVDNDLGKKQFVVCGW